MTPDTSSSPLPPKLADFESRRFVRVAWRSLVPSLAELMNTLGHPTLSARWVGP